MYNRITLGQLIEYLQNCVHEVGEDAEVRIAHQPRWAFEYSIQDSVGIADGIVYLAEGEQVGYLPHKASVAVGWSEEKYDEEEEYA